jgi:apolipoprotein N-acyltransferase
LEGSGDRAQVRAAYAAATNELLDASRREARAGARIIVWPELATYTFPENEATLIEGGQSLARTEHVYLEMAYGVDGQQALARDRAVLIDPQGQVLWIYDKAHPGLSLPSVNNGPGIVPVVSTPYGRLATVICVDAWYPDLMQQVGNRGVDLMLVPGQEWPGTYLWAPHDTSFRAIEYGYALVRPADWDQGMIFDAQGRVLAASDYYTTDQQIVIASVAVKGTWTIYGLVGDLFTWLCMISLFALTVLVVALSLTSAKNAWPQAPASKKGNTDEDLEAVTAKL